MKLMIVDAVGLHPGFLGCYGNEWVATPTLDGLAAQGVVFDNHIADFPLLNADAISSARTGRFGFAPAEGGIDLCGRLQQGGWQVEVARPEALAGFASALSQAIGRWKREKPALLWVDGPSLAPPWCLPDDVLRAYLEEGLGEDEDGQQSGPWSDPPQGYHEELGPADWQRLRATYAAVVSYFDAQIEEAWQALLGGGWTDELVLCVTARSSLPLGEHGVVGDGVSWLYEERVHAPLLLHFPAGRQAGLRIGAITQPVDIVPSLLELVARQTRQAVPELARPGHGHSFLPILRVEAETIRPFALSALDGDCLREASLRTADAALVLPLVEDERHPRRRAQLYLKPEDRWEVNDLATQHLERGEEMEIHLREALKRLQDRSAT